MPTYTFHNNQTDEVFEKMMKFSEVEQFLEDNPNVTKLIDAPSFIGGISIDSGRLPDGLKDRFRLMKEKHPKSRGVDHLI